MNPEFIARPSPVAYNQEFGTSVALSDGVAIIGAINDAPGPGAAYMFAVDGAGTTLLPPIRSRATTSAQPLPSMGDHGYGAHRAHVVHRRLAGETAREAGWSGADHESRRTNRDDQKGKHRKED